MSAEQQYVISFNDFPEEVCAPGTTEAQAQERCHEIKGDYLLSNPGVDGLRIHVRYRSVRVYKP